MGINENEPYNLYNFRQTVGDPARPYLWMVTIPEIGTDTVVTAMARSTQLPGFKVNEIAIPFQGVNMYIGGTPTFDEWTVTFIADEGHELRRIFLKWASLIYDVGTGFVGHSSSYKSDRVGVAQLARNNKKVARMGLVGAFPTNVAAIELAQAGATEAEQFAVTFRYDYFVQVNQFGEQTMANTMVRPTGPVQLGRASAPPAGNWTAFRPQ